MGPRHHRAACIVDIRSTTRRAPTSWACAAYWSYRIASSFNTLTDAPRAMDRRPANGTHPLTACGGLPRHYRLARADSRLNPREPTWPRRARSRESDDIIIRSLSLSSGHPRNLPSSVSDGYGESVYDFGIVESESTTARRKLAQTRE